MSARRILATAGVCATLAACATVSERGLDGGPAEMPPAPTPNYDWIPAVEPGRASLAYGVPESDDVPLMLTCAPGSGRVEITRPAQAPRSALTLSVGTASLTVRTTSTPSQLHDGVFLTGEASTAEPALQAFRRTGWMWVREDGERHGLAAHPGTLAGIERFFQACGEAGGR